METTTAFKIKEEMWPSKTFIIKKDKLPFDKLSGFFTKEYGAIYAALGKLNTGSDHPPYAFYYSVDEKNNMTELAAAIEVNDPNINVPGFEKITLPAGKVITTRHTGSYETMHPKYEAMDEYVKEKGLKKELMIEQYLSDPATEKNPKNWETDIYFIVK